MKYGKKLKIRDLVKASPQEQTQWACQLKDFVNQVMTEDNAAHAGNAVSGCQEAVWMDCFQFLQDTLCDLSTERQEFELIFEYCMPGTVHQRPDVFLLTDSKAISLEFKKKQAPQMDDNKDDVAQAIRYREWLQNHHKVTRDRKLTIQSYLVCTHPNALSGDLRGIMVLTRDNFSHIIDRELEGERICSFAEQWLSSPKTEMPDMLRAIEIMYQEGRIPYLSDVNGKCLCKVNSYISNAKTQHKKLLLLINGVPGAGKTAIGQCVVYEQNRGGKANAVYLSGNGPLVEVLQYQINQVGHFEHMGENAIQGMKEFKAEYFGNDRIPEQSILVFDEAQRAWDAEKMGRGYSEPEGLFRVGEKIYNERGYAVLVGLYGNGQVIYTGEERGLSLWEEALLQHQDWKVVVSEDLADTLQGLGERKVVDKDVFLPVSLRADFVDCSRWVEEAIKRPSGNLTGAREELEKLYKTSMRICMTRSFDEVREYAGKINADHPDWKYGLLLSNFAEASILKRDTAGWELGFGRNNNTVSKAQYGEWFAGNCKSLRKACSVYGNQGLELDCPIVIFGGDFIRQNRRWKAQGWKYGQQRENYADPEAIVENNYRVLLTRARKQLILFIPKCNALDETYQYFRDMGVDELSV